MTRRENTRLLDFLHDVSFHVLPASRREWGEAMSAERAYVDERDALAQAIGSLIAALKERVRDFDSRFSLAVGLIALVTAVCAFDRMVCAIRGAQILMGRPDGMLALLRKGAMNPELVARYEMLRPFVVACFFGLGVAYMLGAWLLLRKKWAAFSTVSAMTLAIAVCAIWLQLLVVGGLDGVPSEVDGLVVQAIFIPLILAWSNGRSLDWGSRR